MNSVNHLQSQEGLMETMTTSKSGLCSTNEEYQPSKKGLSMEFIFYPIKPLQPLKHFKCPNDMTIFELPEGLLNVIWRVFKAKFQAKLKGKRSL